MSVEVFLYSERREVVERPLLKRQLEQEGWKSLFLASWPDVRLVNEGPCVDDLIVGCKLHTDLVPIQDLIKKKDVGGIEQLLAEECFANCALSTECPYEFSATYHGEELRDLIRELGSEPVEAMKRAASMYCVRIHGMQNELSGHFQNAVWDSLGQLCGGLLDDPQTGNWRIISSGQSAGLD